MFIYLKEKSNNSYAHGSLNNLESYFSNKYNSNPILIREKILDLPYFTMKEVDSSKKHCSLTAITRVLLFYNSMGYENIPDNKEEIYHIVKKYAKRNLGYFSLIGTIPFRIASIIKSTLKFFHYDNKVKGKYIWNFYSEIENEIDNNRPVILNIARGYYRKHTVVVVGYRVYIVNGNIYHIAIINDGWNYNLSFIDFTSFSKNILLAGVGSFNKINIKN